MVPSEGNRTTSERFSRRGGIGEDQAREEAAASPMTTSELVPFDFSVVPFFVFPSSDTDTESVSDGTERRSTLSRASKISEGSICPNNTTLILEGE